MTTQVTHIVSLGCRCAVAHNLRRFYGFEDAYPFDWWITPQDTLERVLREPDPEAIYDPAQLERPTDKQTVIQRRYGMHLHHEFPRDAEGLIVADFARHVAKPKARTASLLQRFFALDAPGNRILFVRDGGAPPQLDALLRRLFPRASWKVAMLPAVSEGHADWEGDPAEWDAELRSLDVTLAARPCAA